MQFTDQRNVVTPLIWIPFPPALGRCCRSSNLSVHKKKSSSNRSPPWSFETGLITLVSILYIFSTHPYRMLVTVYFFLLIFWNASWIWMQRTQLYIKTWKQTSSRSALKDLFGDDLCLWAALQIRASEPCIITDPVVLHRHSLWFLPRYPHYFGRLDPWRCCSICLR